MLNRVLIVGNIGKDPEVNRLQSGAIVAKVGLATSENYRDKQGEWQSQTEWHDIVLWNALAEKAENQLYKGAQVYLEGKLTHRTWDDKDGNKRKTTEVVASYFRVLSKREDAAGATPAKAAQVETEPEYDWTSEEDLAF